MAGKTYIAPAKRGESSYEDRKSVFLGHVCPVENEEEASAFVLEMKKKYSDARHNVWAYCLHGGAMRSSDDGEPAGTGGAPVLETLTKRGLTDAVIVVTRYFGGILLGTGGLVRAYTAAASAALKDAGTVEVVPYLDLSLVCSYGQYGKVTRLAEKYGAEAILPEFSDGVRVSLLLQSEDAERFISELAEATGGSVNAEITGETPLRRPLEN